MKRRIFTWFTFIVMLFVASFQEAKAVALHFQNKTKFELDYGAVLVLDTGYYYDMTNLEGSEYPIYRPMSIELPLGFQLKSLTINGREHVDPQHIRELISLHIPHWVTLDSMRYDIKAEIVPDTITSPEILVSILNAYEPESAVLVDKNHISLNKTIKYTEKEYPHIIELGSDSLIIDGRNNCLYIPRIQLNSGNIKMKNIKGGLDNHSIYILQKNGELSIESSDISSASSFLEQEGGLFRMDYSSIGQYGEDEYFIILKGKDAKTEIISGEIRENANLIVLESGTLDVKGGFIHPESIQLKGGTLNVSGGYVNDIIVMDNSAKISLSGGEFRGVDFVDGVTIPASSSLLADGFIYATEYMGMIYPLGKEIESYPGDGMTSFSISNVIPDDYILEETAVFKAAKSADIGPNGKDVKVNGKTYEIYTPEGLAWLAVITLDEHSDLLENGKEYCPVSYPRQDTDTLKLMNDLDMNEYGYEWPGIYIDNNILEGQGHRIYNMNITGATPSFISQINTGGIVRNLEVEGSIRITHTDFDSASGVFIGVNEGTILNCAFLGSVFSEVVGGVRVTGFIGGNWGNIQNCYVNTCGKPFGGIRPSEYISEYNDSYPGKGEWYEITKFVESNSRGTIENCYFAGEAKFENSQDVRIYGFYNDSNNPGDPGTFIDCYESPNISVETLNANVQNHEQDAEYPWATWAVDSTKYNGYPFHVFEQTIQKDSIALKKVGQGNLVAKYITSGDEQTIKADTIVEIDVPKTLTLVASPAEGYSLEKIVFNPKNGEEIELEEIEAGKEFELSVSGGIITAYFKEDSIPTPEEPAIIEKDSTLTSTINGDSLIVQGGTENDALELNVSGITIPSLTINTNSVVSLSISGDNDLGKIENNGTLVIQNNDGNLDVEIENKGTFIDYTGTLTEVSGFSINSIGDETVKEGETVTLVASASIDNNVGNVIYQWQRFVDNVWVDVNTETIQTRAAIVDDKPNELIVSSSETGAYRCLITYTNEEVSTTLTAYAEVSLDASAPEDPDEDTDEPDDSEDTSRPDDTPTYYNVKVDDVCEGVEVQLSNTVVKEGNQISVYIKVAEGYDAENLKVYFKQSPFNYWEEVKEGVQPGEYIIYNVWADISIKVEGAVKEEPTGIDHLEGVKVYAKDGSIYVYTPNREEVVILNMTGVIVKSEEQVGLVQYDGLERGIYIIRIGDNVFKIKN